MREWRNRQTRTVQVRVPERAWGFNSPLAHKIPSRSRPALTGDCRVFGGLAACLICYGILPLLGQTLGRALTGLFFLFLTFEFTIVTGLSLFTELVPASRATMMAGYLAMGGVGRVVGALICGPIWLAGGIYATALVSAAISGLALVSLIWGLRSWQRS